ncbi:MAG TPA: thiamine pyrophosphate-binding protein, partial [Rhizobiales bacterium]|nr:thiamine pyrophosphate-binding protein [Hyphomicrobiales bacterium]
AIITNGAGNYTAFVHRYTQYKGHHSQLATTSGTMGYGLPAAIGGQLAAPERKVVCYAGDGCFLMNGQELATAVRYNLPIVIIVVNNGMYGTIRMHQERNYPGRVSGTKLQNPDFAAYARSFGANGETVLKTADFASIFDAALNADRPTVIELKIDPEAITPTATLSEIRNNSA